MSYVALYRKWRPADFDQVKGQDAIVRTLRNQIIYERIGHAYLFCGTRGTGKTSIAKLFAKAVNCENPVNGNPCGTCPSCRAIADQASMDVIEIDAASNNHVDDVRQIRDQVQYMPTIGRYKVYIVDEVHMLTTNAFNALLKTLEEPPAHVIFILATTEKHKVPVTILSRCQQYDFRRISVETIAGHLADLMEKEQIEAEARGLQFVARMADGSMRDALSLLDQCIAFYLNQALTYEKIIDVLGAADTTIYSNLLKAVTQRDVPGVLDIIDGIIMEGMELTRFINDFLWYLRNLLLLKDNDTSSKAEEIVLDMSAENISRMQAETAWLTTGEMLHMIRVLSDLSSQLRYSTQKRVLLEVAFIKLCRPDMETGTESLLARIERLEEDMAHAAALQKAGAFIPASPSSGDAPWQGGPGSIEGAQPGDGRSGNPESGAAPRQGGPGSMEGAQAADPDQLLEDRFTPAEAEDLRKIASSWNRIVGAMDNPMRRHLRQAKIAVADDSSMLQLIFDEDNPLSDNAKAYFEKRNHENLDILSEAVAKRTGRKAAFQCIMRPASGKTQTDFIDLSLIHFDNIETVDE